jgi:uncharacterized protein YfdQ (DUF2303 family)
MELTREAIDRVLQLGAAQDVPFKGAAEGDALCMVPNGYCVQSLAPWCPPTRVKRKVALIEAGSFCDYVNRFKNGDTLIFAAVTETGATLTALLDYHGAPVRADGESTEPKANYCEHMATLALSETVEWRGWRMTDRKPMSQFDFATWLEENSGLFNCVKDGVLRGAELLELVNTLHGKSDVRFSSMIRLKDGSNKLAYDEDVGLQGKINGGSIELPSVISAGMVVFQGGEPFQVDARLKSRIEGRKLSLWYETIALHKIVRDSILNTVRLVADRTQIVPLIGNAG